MPAPACVYRTPLTRRDLPPPSSNGVPHRGGAKRPGIPDDAATPSRDRVLIR